MRKITEDEVYEAASILIGIILIGASVYIHYTITGRSGSPGLYLI
jgi:hypothetical protein